MAAEATFILVDGRADHGDAVDGAHSGDVCLRRSNRGRQGEGGRLIRGVRVVAVHAGGVAIVIEHGGFRFIVDVGARGQEMGNLGEFAVNIWSRGRNVCSTAVAGNAVLRAGIDAGCSGRCQTHQPRGAVGVVLRVAGSAGVDGDGGVRADIGGARHLIRRDRVDAGGPAGQHVGLSGHDAIGIVAREAHLSVGTIADQEFLRHTIDALHVRIVAANAFDVAGNQLDCTGGIRGHTLGDKRSGHIRRIFQRHHQAERVRATQICAQHIHVVHSAGDRNFSVDGGLAHGNCAIVTTQTKTAGLSQRGLCSLLLKGGAGVKRVGLTGKCLVPQGRDAANASVWRVAEVAAESALRGYGRAAAGRHIVHAQNVALNWWRGCLCLRDGTARKRDECEEDQHAFHGVLPAAVFAAK